MTLMQIQIAVAIARTGSVSAAAEALNISQPNASNAIRSIENELGVKLFRRVSRGLVPTEHGYRFIDHAAALLREYELLCSLRTDAPPLHLRLGVTNYTPPINAFRRLCVEIGGDAGSKLSYLNVSSSVGASMLNERKLDMVVCILPDNYATLIGKELNEYLTVLPICPLSVTIKLRQGHPALQPGTADDVDALLRELRQYPYVEYQSQASLEELRQYRMIPNLQYSYSISVDDRESRFELASETDAFLVGSQSPVSQLERYGLVQFPIPGLEVWLMCLVRKGEEERREFLRYLELLRAEMQEII